jgi:hypothetical protein
MIAVFAKRAKKQGTGTLGKNGEFQKPQFLTKQCKRVNPSFTASLLTNAPLRFFFQIIAKKFHLFKEIVKVSEESREENLHRFSSLNAHLFFES